MTGIGVPTPRLDATAKVTGAARYAADSLPEAGPPLIALGVQSRVAHGRITAIDTTAACATPGVAAVYTHENAAMLGWTSTPEIDARFAENLGRRALGDAASRLPAYRPLISPEILFAGQWIAVVVAETFEAACSARDSVAVTIDPWPSPAGDPIAPGPFFAGDMQYSRGPADAADRARAVVREEYETPMQLHQPMEPSATTAVWGPDGDVTLFDSTQGTHATRDAVALSLGIAPDAVHVNAAFVGGGFGAKNQIWPHQALAAHIARHLKRAVRVQLSRSDMAVASGYRSRTRQSITLAADADGRLLSLRHHSTVPTSLRGGFFEPCGLNALMLYASEHVAVSHSVVREAVSTPTPFRAPGETPGSFALETALDELAVRIGMDPIALRIRNFADRDAFHDRPWSTNELLECYRRGAARFGWPEAPAELRSKRDGPILIGYGMATTAYPAPAHPATVRLTLHTGGVLVETSATDIGTGMRTILAQAAADGLSLPLDAVSVSLGASDLPLAPTAGRSKSTASVLPALADGCRALIAALDAVDPASTNQPLMDRLAQSGRGRLAVEGHAGGLATDGPTSHYSFGAHFVEIRVDPRIGRLRVTRIVSAIDCGRILNPLTAASQIKGGVIFGIGMALMEDACRSVVTGKVFGDNFADYAIPVNADVPPIDVVFVEKPDLAHNEFGARGLGEIGLPGVAAAIGNAVHDATGRRCRSLPIPMSLLID